MTAPVYEKLTETLSLRGGGLPAIKCPEFYAVIEELFTPEEAEIGARMPLSPIAAEALASEIAGDPQNVKKLLETMADKGLVCTHEIGGVRHYTLMGFIPGTFETQFMKGEVNERTKKLAHLFRDYYIAMAGLKEGIALALPAYPFARVITVEQEIPTGVEVYPYDKASDYIANSDCITVGICACRHFGELLGQPCDKPKETCMFFGPMARYFGERGFSRFISKEEALEILDRAEKAGLVHCSTNSSEHIDFICNCCICHCGILQSIKSAALPSSGANSGFIMVVDEDECMGCGDCIDQCPMEAISMQNDVVTRDADRCIGCGLCISVCPTSALIMEPREQRPIPPQNPTELNMAMMASMPKDEAMPGEEEEK